MVNVWHPLRNPLKELALKVPHRNQQAIGKAGKCKALRAYHAAHFACFFIALQEKCHTGFDRVAPMERNDR